LGEYIERDDLFVVMDAFKLQYKYLSSEVGLPKHHYIGRKDLLRLRKEDLKILEILDGNGRIPVIKIATELKLSAPVISYKIKNLIKSGLIQGFRPLLNPTTLGLQWYIISFKLNNVSEKEEEKFIAYLRQNKNTVYLTRGIGAFNLVLDVHVENVVKMDNLLNDIRSKFSKIIKNYSPLLVVDNPKTSFLPKELLNKT
jgi:Lrp/AsnC family leucine-responsive transcriptional regulator